MTGMKFRALAMGCLLLGVHGCGLARGGPTPDVRVGVAKEHAAAHRLQTPGFPADWARPKPVEEVFTGSSGVTCGAAGQTRPGGTLDTVTNPRKNRIDDAQGAHVLSLRTIESLPEDLSAPHNRTKWTAAQQAAVAGFEGVAVSATGFMSVVDTSGDHARHEKAESCNCDLVGPDEVDWHIYLVPGAAASRSAAVVVELTPRVRRSHPGWSDAALKAASDSVRVTGWLMYDPDHPDQVGKTRATVWEIHPVTKLEVWERGAWNNLDAHGLHTWSGGGTSDRVAHAGARTRRSGRAPA